MPLRQKILYYGLMLGLTLLALEGMARLAYYAAYGEGYSGGGLNTLSELTPPPPPEDFTHQDATPWRISHPFYGYTRNLPYHALNAMPPRPGRGDTVVVGLLGGSVARDVQPFLQRALNRWFGENNLSRQPIVLGLAVAGQKQPQQAIIVANTLLLGGEFDFIVNLDGFNELTASMGLNFPEDLFPFYPLWWDNRVSLTNAEVFGAGRIGVLRRKQARLAAAGETSPLRGSAFFGLANRYRQERTADEIIQRNRQLAAAAADYSLEKHGPRTRRPAGRLYAETARLWYRGSLLLAQLAQMTGADYYHFLQPNQYVPDSKPLSRQEREAAYAPHSVLALSAARGYPQLRQFNRDLTGQGIRYFDLTGIFTDRRETLYKNPCCHLNDRGNELLAAAMVQRMAPALRRRYEAAAAPVSALAAAGPPPELRSPGYANFQVSLQDDGKYLRYVRAGCALADTEPLFFLHLIPQDLTDLPPSRRESGFDDITFSFARIGGGFQWGECVAQFPLPDYPIAALRTGQQRPGEGELWSVELIIPADPAPLRADYAALSAANPVARDYFDLYELDNRLLYLRETCAAADTAAPFFLHIIPESVADLPEDRRAAGFAYGGFAFARQGGHFDGKCLAAVSLPDYPIKEMRTGQHIPGQKDPLWSVQLIAAPDFNQLRADYAALAAAKPAARDYFDLYWQDNRLVYLRESCAAADTAANFFLHIVPADAADLPENRREAGFAHGGFEFVRQGGHFDGKCLAAVALPDYPIKEMRTGQHIPGQGDLWSAELTVAR